MRAKALEKRIDFTLTYSTALPRRVHTDALRLRQVLINLVGNAIKFTARGEVALVVGVDRADNRIRFEIRDTGDGIDPAALEHIFDPFKQADGTVTRRHGGTGLGLTISRKFARALGGDVTVASRPGVGSAFTVSIDMGDVSAEPFVEANARSRRSAVDGDWSSDKLPRGLKVLVVDDADVNRKLMRVLLHRAGCVVSEAVDGLDAQRMSRLAHPDIILMDIQMPRMDGYSATRRLRASGYRGIVIACTADAMETAAAGCRAAGCNDFLSKPIDPRSLFEVLARAAASFDAVPLDQPSTVEV